MSTSIACSMHGGYAPVTTVLTTNYFAKADNL